MKFKKKKKKKKKKNPNLLYLHCDPGVKVITRILLFETDINMMATKYDQPHREET